MMDLDSVLNGQKEEATEVSLVPEQAPEQPLAEPEQPAGDTSAVEESAADEGESPSPEQGSDVPYAAYRAERDKRQDWKEKAIRLEEQLKAAEARQQVAPQQAPVPLDLAEMPPEVRQQLEAFNQRAEVSEMITRSKHGDEAVDKAHAAFAEAMQKNPALQAAMFQQQNPWDYVFREGQKLLAMQEIGEDPNAYRERIREELRAELLAQKSQTQPAPVATAQAVAIPTSLAQARSSAPRSAAAFTGPTPLENILKRG